MEKNKIILRRKKLLHILNFTDTNIYHLYTDHVACLIIPKHLGSTGWSPFSEYPVFTLIEKLPLNKAFMI